jgi:hypothetical protein
MASHLAATAPLTIFASAGGIPPPRRLTHMKTATRLTIAIAVATLGACGGTPSIQNTTVTPSTFQTSGVVSSANFTITTDIIDLGASVHSATASVEGQSITVDLVKQQDVAGGEEWGQTTQLTLWSGISSGTYLIDVTATSTSNVSVTQKDAASVTITN